MSVFVLGALHLDVVVRAPRLPNLDETLVGQGVDYVFGGKGGNQAVAAARMGAKVAMAGAVGRDTFAQTLLATLDAAGIDRGQVIERDGASGMSVAILDEDGEYGAVIVSAANLSATGEVNLPADTTTLLLQNEIPGTANLAAASKAKAQHVRVVLNAAPAQAVPEEMMQLTDILIVNRGEAATLTDVSDPTAAAQSLTTRGPATAVVTLGADGLVAHDRDLGTLIEPAPSVKAISSHGAGDAFTGALAARLDKGEVLRDALRFATTAAALHVAASTDHRKTLTARDVLDRLGQSPKSGHKE